jgi:hypothetical protein
MSWGGFKKSIARTGTTIMQKTGQVDRTVDSEFADVEARYRALEKEVLALQKEAKAYLDAVRCECGEMESRRSNFPGRRVSACARPAPPLLLLLPAAAAARCRAHSHKRKGVTGATAALASLVQSEWSALLRSTTPQT